jgi:hypothetical protein
MTNRCCVPGDNMRHMALADNAVTSCNYRKIADEMALCLSDICENVRISHEDLPNGPESFSHDSGVWGHKARTILPQTSASGMQLPDHFSQTKGQLLFVSVPAKSRRSATTGHVSLIRDHDRQAGDTLIKALTTGRRCSELTRLSCRQTPRGSIPCRDACPTPGEPHKRHSSPS